MFDLRLAVSVRFQKLLPGLTAFSVLALCSGTLLADAKSQPAEQAITPAATNLGRAVDFKKDIEPIFEAKCVACHAGGFSENGLNLEEVKFMLKGGKRGPAIVPGKPELSLIYTLAARSAKPAMPPLPNRAEAVALTPIELGLLKQWIQEGASESSGAVKKRPVYIPIPEHVQRTHAVALTSDGVYAAAGRANKIVVYHVPSGKQVAELTDPNLLTLQYNGKPAYGPGTSHRDFVHSLAFNPEGTLLASGGDREVKLWSRPDPVAKGTLATTVGKTAVAAFSKDDAWLAVALADNSIQLTEMKKGAAGTKKLAGHAAGVTGVQFSADGKRLFSCSADKTIRVWEVADGKLFARIETPSPLNGLTLSQDGKRIITAGADKVVRVWDLPGAAAEPLPLAAAPVATAVSPDRKILAIADADGKISLIDLATRKLLVTSVGHQGAVHSLAFQANGTKLVSGGADKTVRVWDVATGKAVLVLQGPSTPALSVGWMTSNQQVASGGSDGKVTLWKLDVPAPRPIAAGAAPATITAVSRDGKLLAVDGTVDGKPAVIVRDLASGQITKSLTGHTAAVTALAFSSDGTRLISGSADKTVLVFNLADGKTVGKFTGHSQPISAVAVLTANNATAISASSDNTLKVWNVADGKEQTVKFSTAPGPITALVGLASGQFITAGDATVRVWNGSYQAGTTIAFGQPVTALALSADGTKLAIGGRDKSAKIYQLDGKPLFTLEGHGAAIRGLAFSADGTRLVTAGTDNAARVYEVASGLLLETFPVAGLNGAQFAGSAAAVVLAGADKSLATQAVHAERVIVSPQAKAVTALLFTQKGDSLFIAQEEGSLRKVATANGQQQAALNHGAAIRALALSGDGAILASAGDNFQVKLWTAANGAPHAKPILTGASAAIRGISFLPDNQHIAEACDDKRVVVFSVKLGTPEQVFADHTDAVRAVFPSVDGKQFTSVSSDKTARTWPLLAGTQISGHTGPVTAIAALPGSNQVVTGSDDGTVRFWDVNGGNQTRTVAHGAPVRALAVRPDGKFLVSVGANNTAKLWNAANNQLVLDLRGDHRTQQVVLNLQADDAEIKGLLGSLKGQIPPAEKKVTELTATLAKATETKTAAEKKLAETMPKAKAAADQAMAAKKAADDKKADKALAKAAEDAKKASDTAAADLKKVEDEKAKASDAHLQAEANLREANTALTKLKTEQDATLARQKQVDPELAAARKAAQDREKPFLTAAFSADNKNLLLGSELGSIAVFDATTGQPLEVFDAHKGNVLAASFLNDGSIFSIGADQSAKTWDLLPPWKLVAVLGPKPDAPLDVQDSVFVGRVLCLAFSPDGKVLASGGGEPSRSGEIILWDVAGRKLIKPLNEVHSDTVFGLQFSRNGKQLLSGAADKFVKIIDVQTGKVVKPFEGHTGHVLDVAWRHDGKRIASAGADNAVKVWNVETGEQERTIQGFGKQVTALQYMGRGDNLVSSCGDKTVRFHTGSNGGNFRNFAGANDYLYSAAASADEKVVVAGGQDGVIRVWNGTNGQLLLTLSPAKTSEARKTSDAVARP